MLKRSNLAGTRSGTPRRICAPRLRWSSEPLASRHLRDPGLVVRVPKPCSKSIRPAAASAANASGSLQTALSKVTRRSAAIQTRGVSRRVTSDRELTFLDQVLAEVRGGDYAPKWTGTGVGRPLHRTARRGTARPSPPVRLEWPGNRPCQASHPAIAACGSVWGRSQSVLSRLHLRIRRWTRPRVRLKRRRRSGH